MGESMKSYKVLITSTLGTAGDQVILPENSQTQERLKKGIVCEVKVIKAEEFKGEAAKHKRKVRARK
tara:strand:+ start:123 stop:323 length:201 start_codon:yes stop_codon:yes gene_type:complete